MLQISNHFSINLATKVPMRRDQMGALIFNKVILDKAITKVRAALNFIFGLENPVAKLFPNTPRRAKPTSREVKDLGNS